MVSICGTPPGIIAYWVVVMAAIACTAFCAKQVSHCDKRHHSNVHKRSLRHEQLFVNMLLVTLLDRSSLFLTAF